MCLIKKIRSYRKRKRSEKYWRERLLEEVYYPKDEKGRPDLSYYTKPLGYYINMYEEFLATYLKGDLEIARMPYDQRIHGSWGLISKGSEAIPYALSLLTRKEPEAREDACGIFLAFGEDENVLDQVISKLQNEPDTLVRDTMILVLGEMKNIKAIPILAEFIFDPATDGDTRWTAIESLGKIVRKRFLKKEDPELAARVWLQKNGYTND